MNIINWEDSLRKGAQPCQSKIRFDLSYVPISHFAKQYFCEKQLDYEYSVGKETSEKEIEGTFIHEDVFAAEEVDLEQIIESIANSSFYACAFPLYFETNGISFCGTPDGVIFSEGKPILLIELKTTSGNPYTLYKNQTIQAEAYAFALENMGFDCKNLCVVIISIDKLTAMLYGEECINIVTNGIEQLITNNQVLNEASLKKIQEYLPYEAVIHMIELDNSRFLKDITDSSMYWKMERDARKMGSFYKCKQCTYSKECTHYDQKWSVEENKKLAEEHSKGTSIEEIAKMLGKTTTSINNQLIRQKYPKHGQIWSERDINRLTKLFSQDLATWYIADVLKRKPSAIEKKLVDLGLIEKTNDDSPSVEEVRKEFPKYLTPWNEEDIVKLVEMFHEKKSIDEISHILQRTKYGIIAKLERLGLIKPNVASVKICDACNSRDNCTLNLNKRIYTSSNDGISSDKQQYDTNLWNEEEVTLMRNKFSEGIDTIELAKILQKNQPSIEKKLITIGLIDCPLYKSMPEML